MQISTEDITAQCYKESNGIYYLKFNFERMYVSGVTVRRSIKDGGWWVQMPAYRASNGSWKKYIEFVTGSEIRKKVEQACIQAVTDYGSDTQEPDTVVFPTDEELEKPANLDGLPF